MSLIMKYTSLDAVGETPLGEIIDDMGELGSAQLAVVITDKQDRTLGGVILLRGDDADRYMRAIRDVERQIEQEQESAEG